MAEERLQKIISQAGIASRRAAEKMILEGRVRVDGKVVCELGTKVNPAAHTISVDGRPIKGEEQHVYLLLNKPKGYLSTAKDDRGRRTVLDLLPEVKKGEYDFIILDPPAFTKSRRTVGRAEKGYKEINLRALKALPRGGYFATASCSHFMPSELFVKMLRSAAQDANVELRQIEARQQAPDHPILWNVPETDYLKFYIFQVV